MWNPEHKHFYKIRIGDRIYDARYDREENNKVYYTRLESGQDYSSLSYNKITCQFEGFGGFRYELILPFVPIMEEGG